MNHDRYDDFIYGRGGAQRSARSDYPPFAAGSEKVGAPSHWLAKLLALLFLGVCLVLGVIGAILPILPGIVFFGFAALIAAWLFPSLRKVFERQPQLNRYLNATDGIATLPWRQQLHVVGWVGLRIVVDSFRLLFQALTRLMRFATRAAP